MARRTSMTGAGLCDRCRHQSVVANTRGSSFSRCLRSGADPAYPKYPRIPVVACPGFEPAGGDRGPDTPPAAKPGPGR